MQGAGIRHPEFDGRTITYVSEAVDVYYSLLPSDPRVELLENLGFGRVRRCLRASSLTATTSVDSGSALMTSRLPDVFSPSAVQYGETVRVDDRTTVLPVSRRSARGAETAVGLFTITDGTAVWTPAVDTGRIQLMECSPASLLRHWDVLRS